MDPGPQAARCTFLFVHSRPVSLTERLFVYLVHLDVCMYEYVFCLPSQVDFPPGSAWFSSKYSLEVYLLCLICISLGILVFVCTSH